MGIKSYNPTTSSLRHRTGLTYEELTSREPYKPLLEPLKKSGGRNSKGRISVRHRGGGHKRAYRIIDFKRDKLDVPGEVETIEYDPNRSSFISLIKYRDGERRYILTTQNMSVGQTVLSSNRQVDILPGNSMPLRFIPLGTVVHNIELKKAREGRSPRPPVPGLRSSRKRETMPRSGCRPPRSGRCIWSAGRPWERSAIPITRIFPSGKRAANAGWAAGLMSGEQP